MAEVVGKAQIEVSATMRFNERELRALDALVGYGADAFLKVFYQHLGEHYMKPNEDGLRSLFDSIQNSVPGILKRGHAAREAFTAHK